MFDVVLITGAADTGKTLTAQAWATSRRSVAAHLSHGDVLLRIKSGLASPAHETTSEAERQWRIAIEICTASTKIYADHQVQCAIDTFLLPDHLSFWSGLAHLRVGLVLLHPPVDLAIQRNAERLAKTGWGVPESQVRGNHAAMSAWKDDPRTLIPDTSNLSFQHSVAAIDAWETSGNGVAFFPN